MDAGRRVIACSRMYNLAPEIAAAWTLLFDWVADRSGIDLDVIAHPAPSPLEDLWARDNMGCVFMCGWPYSVAEPRPVLLAAPVPAPARYQDRPIYFTDLIVRKDSGFETLEDTFGGRVAWTVEHSHSGFNALRHHLLPHLGDRRRSLYAESVGPLVSPVRVLQSILDGDADVGPLDSMALDLWRKHAPERVADIRVIATTAAAPCPPLVAAPSVDGNSARGLRSALLAAHAAPELSDVLETLLLRRFVEVDPTDYAVLNRRAEAALAAHYPVPA